MSIHSRLLIFATEFEQEILQKQLSFLANWYQWIEYQSSVQLLLESQPAKVNIICSWSCFQQGLDKVESKMRWLNSLLAPIIVLDGPEVLRESSVNILYWQSSDSQNALRGLLQNQYRWFLMQSRLQDIQRRQGLKNDLLALLAHDMNGPITPLIGYLELLDEDEFLQKKEIHGLMQSALRRLAQQIEYFNILSGLNEISYELKQDRFQLSDVWLALDNLTADLFHRQRLTLAWARDVMPMVCMDKLYFERTLWVFLYFVAGIAVSGSQVNIQSHVLSLPRLLKRRIQAYSKNQLFDDFFVAQSLPKQSIECLISVQAPLQDDLCQRFSHFLREEKRIIEPVQTGLLLGLDLLRQCLLSHQLCFYLETQADYGFSIGFVVPIVGKV